MTHDPSPSASTSSERTPKVRPPLVDEVLAYRVRDAERVSGLSRSKLYMLMAEGTPLDHRGKTAAHSPRRAG